MNRRTLLRTAALAAALVASTCALAPSARAGQPVGDTEALASMRGTYRFAGGAAERRALHAAIDRVVDQMSFVIRGMARSAIRDNVRPEAQVAITPVDPTHLRVTLGDWTSPPMSTDGAIRTVRGPDGNSTRFSVRLHDGRLYTRAVTSRGTRENWITVADGQLRMQSRIHAEQLPAPISYALTFRRAP